MSQLWAGFVINMGVVQIYTSERCGACDDLKRDLDSKGIPYISIDVAELGKEIVTTPTVENRQKLKEIVEGGAVPITYVNDKRFVGYDEGMVKDIEMEYKQSEVKMDETTTELRLAAEHAQKYSELTKCGFCKRKAEEGAQLFKDLESIQDLGTKMVEEIEAKPVLHKISELRQDATEYRDTIGKLAEEMGVEAKKEFIPKPESTMEGVSMVLLPPPFPPLPIPVKKRSG